MRTPRIRRAGPYVAKSCADGSIVVEPKWPDGLDGFAGRMELAEEIAAFLNERTAKPAREARGT